MPNNRTDTPRYLGITPNRWKIIATIITLVTMVVGKIFEQQGLPGILWLYAISYIAGGWFGLIAGFRSLLQRNINIDLLMILAAAGAAVVGNYFEGGLLLFLFSLSNVLQDFAIDKSQSAIHSLMNLQPVTVEVIQKENEKREENGESLELPQDIRTEIVPIGKVTLNSLIVVRPGTTIALDGVVVSGNSTVDQSPITGEGVPVSKHARDTVFAGTINLNGGLKIRTTSTEANSTLAKVIKMVAQANEQKSSVHHFLEKIEQKYAILVILATLVAIVAPLLWGAEFQPTFYRAMTLMVAASPCAVFISTPLTIWAAIGMGARNGVLFKGGIALERGAKTKVVAFDKTGTLTKSSLTLCEIKAIPVDWNGADLSNPSTGGTNPVALDTDRKADTDADINAADTMDHRWLSRQITDDEVLELAATVEQESEHLLAKAIAEEAARRNIQITPLHNFKITAGRGLHATLGSHQFRIGNLQFFESYHPPAYEKTKAYITESEMKNRTVVVLGEIIEGHRAILLGLLSFENQIRPEALHIIAKIKKIGIEHIVMLTGDNRNIANSFAHRLNIDAVYSELLPDQKIAIIEQLEQEIGPVAMIGDGINDAPALARASLGVAMGVGGTDIARETADVVLMTDNLQKVPIIFDVSRRARRTMSFNLVFTISIIAVMIVFIFARDLPLQLATIGHEGSTVLAAMNGLRLFFHRYRNSKKR